MSGEPRPFPRQHSLTVPSSSSSSSLLPPARPQSHSRSHLRSTSSSARSISTSTSTQSAKKSQSQPQPQPQPRRPCTAPLPTAAFGARSTRSLFSISSSSSSSTRHKCPNAPKRPCLDLEAGSPPPFQLEVDLPPPTYRPCSDDDEDDSPLSMYEFIASSPSVASPHPHSDLLLCTPVGSVGWESEYDELPFEFDVETLSISPSPTEENGRSPAFVFPPTPAAYNHNRINGEAPAPASALHVSFRSGAEEAAGVDHEHEHVLPVITARNSLGLIFPPSEQGQDLHPDIAFGQGRSPFHPAVNGSATIGTGTDKQIEIEAWWTTPQPTPGLSLSPTSTATELDYTAPSTATGFSRGERNPFFSDFGRESSPPRHHPEYASPGSKSSTLTSNSTSGTADRPKRPFLTLPFSCEPLDSYHYHYDHKHSHSHNHKLPRRPSTSPPASLDDDMPWHDLPPSPSRPAHPHVTSYSYRRSMSPKRSVLSDTTAVEGESAFASFFSSAASSPAASPASGPGSAALPTSPASATKTLGGPITLAAFLAECPGPIAPSAAAPCPLRFQSDSQTQTHTRGVSPVRPSGRQRALLPSPIPATLTSTSTSLASGRGRSRRASEGDKLLPLPGGTRGKTVAAVSVGSVLSRAKAALRRVRPKE